MESSHEFVERVLDLRSRGAEARRAERDALAAAMVEMESLLGDMSSFRAMDSAGFPVTIERVRAGYEAEGMPDFGASVVAVTRGGGVSRLYVQARTDEADEFMTLSLHPSKGETIWSLESSSRGFDGSESEQKKDFKSAGRAAQIVRTRLLGMAIRVLSKGSLAELPVLHSEDAAAAKVIAAQVAEAAAAGREADRQRKAHAAQVARSAGAVRAAWAAAERNLGFLADLGYRIGEGDAPLSVNGVPTGSGIEIRVESDENGAVIRFEVRPEDPFMVGAQVRDREGRVEPKGFYHPADDDALRAVMEDVVLAEIETAEASYLPLEEQSLEHSQRIQAPSCC